MILSNVIKDKYLRVVALLSSLILFLTILISYSALGSTTTPLIIHFDAYKGIDVLGSRLNVFGILLSALIIILINLFLSDFLYNRERFLSYIFTFVSLLISILILITVSAIISIN